MFLVSNDNKQVSKDSNQQSTGTILAFPIKEMKRRDTVIEQSPRLRTDLKTSEKVAGFFNKKVVVVRNNTPETFDFGGVILTSDPDTIFININNQFPYLQVVGHELSHLMELDSPQLYNDLLSVVSPLLIKSEEFRALYNLPKDMPESAVTKEMLGDFIGDNFTNKGFWNDMAKADPNIFQRVADYILRFLDTIIGKSFGSFRFVSAIKKPRQALIKTMVQ